MLNGKDQRLGGCQTGYRETGILFVCEELYVVTSGEVKFQIEARESTGILIIPTVRRRRYNCRPRPNHRYPCLPQQNICSR
jgi:hypothetical protein